MILRDLMTVVFVVFLLIATSSADIISLNLRSVSRHSILFSEFGFSHTGHVSVNISSVSVTSTLSQPDRSRIGFYLLSHEFLNGFLFDFERNPNLCALDSEYISVLFTFQDVDANSNSSLSRSYPVSSPNVYSLYLANCNPRSFVTMDLHLELYNTKFNTKDYLSAGLTHLPALYFILSLLYLCFLTFWICVCLKNRQAFHSIHFLMGVLLVITFGYFICGAADQHDLKVTGTHAHHGWDVWFYTFQLMRFVVLYAVIVLIGTGWSLWNPFLQASEILMLMIVILVQVLANIVSISAEATGPYNEKQFDWQIDVGTLDLICGFVIFAPLVWSGLSLRKTCETDENAVENMEKLGSFVMAVVVYVIFTRMVVPALANFLVYKAPLVIHVADETCNLVLCMLMFHLFRPCLRENWELPWYARLFVGTRHLNNTIQKTQDSVANTC